jgi:hypothetical protein
MVTITRIASRMKSPLGLGASRAWRGFALVLLLLLLGTSGCRDKVGFPGVEDILGRWRAAGKSDKDTRTYSGIYDFHTLGSHTYDIILSNGRVKKGKGVWSLEEDKGILRVENDTGSIYVGTFAKGKPTSIALFTINNQWGVQLDKEASGAPAKTSTP